MTDYIHSLLIDPVVRQARRFSGARTDSDPASPTPSLSHATTPAPVEAVHPVATTQDGHTRTTVEEGEGEGALELSNGVPEPGQPFGDAAVPLPLPLPASAEQPPGPRGLETAGSIVGFATPIFAATPTALRDSHIPDYMSYNPSYGAQRAMSGDSGSQPQSHRSASINGRSSRTNTGNTGRNTPISIAEGQSIIVMSDTLPADDGMKLLRERIHEIREMDASNEEKARRMHVLMTERYVQFHPHLYRPTSPASMTSQDQPLTPTSATSPPHSSMTAHSPTSSSGFDSENPFNLDAEAVKPTYRPRSPRQSTDVDPSAEPMDENFEEEPLRLGCRHYLRNVKIQCYDCRRWYSCRHCHDEDPLSSHTVDRRKTQNMLCMLCGTPQPAAEYCGHCKERAAHYYCAICKLWDNDNTKSIYHCGDCGICRKGEGLGKDYVHCKKCNVCISISHFPTHRCLERATECDCPICGAYLFTSPFPVISLRCGHYMHASCRLSYLQTAYKCPICGRSSVNMELQWRKLDEEIRRQPMPEGEGGRVEVRCNDCGAKGLTDFHWLGNKCGSCEGYNTSLLRVVEGRGLEDRTSDGQLGTERSATGEPVGEAALVGATALSPPRGSSPMGREIRGSYFLQDQTGQTPRRMSAEPVVDTNTGGFALSPYQMAQRIARSLSPMRDFMLGADDETPAADAHSARTARQAGDHNRTESFRFWGIDTGFRGIDTGFLARRGASGAEHEAEDMDEEGESEDSDANMMDGEDADAAGAEEVDGMEIFGHR